MGNLTSQPKGKGVDEKTEKLLKTLDYEKKEFQYDIAAYKYGNSPFLTVAVVILVILSALSFTIFLSIQTGIGLVFMLNLIEPFMLFMLLSIVFLIFLFPVHGKWLSLADRGVHLGYCEINVDRNQLVAKTPIAYNPKYLNLSDVKEATFKTSEDGLKNLIKLSYRGGLLDFFMMVNVPLCLTPESTQEFKTYLKEQGVLIKEEVLVLKK